MLLLSRARLILGLALLGAGLLLPSGAAHAQPAKGKVNRKTVPFKTADGVELSGTLYPNPGGKRDAVVLLLHDFDLKKGGGHQKDGWSNLAEQLQKDGYVVFAFDFRGFGASTNVDKNFWLLQHNGPGNIGGKRGKQTIGHQDFKAGYTQYFINDIAAAKAYLDRRNDNKELNSSNVILIGAGEGATIGAAWLAGECRRAKDKTGVAAQLGDPEGRDVAAAIWLSISPRMGGKNAGGYLSNWVRAAGGQKGLRIPTLFVYGKNDSTSSNLSMNLYKSINPQGAKLKDLKRTGHKAIPDTKLGGHHLLGKEHDTVKIIRDHLRDVMEDRGSRESFERKADKFRYVYTDGKGKYYRNNKPAGEDVPPVDLSVIYAIK